MSGGDHRLSAAVNDFRNARRRADVRAILAQLSGGDDRLLPYEEVRRRLRAVEGAQRRLEDIPLDAIVGSVGRYQDFNREFLPLVNEDESRWVNVKLAMTGLAGVPPIEAYRIGDAYFVKDGNHRVSVARQLGAKHIQGYVTTVHSPVPLGSDADRDDLIIASEHADFLEQTRIGELRPEADLSVTAPGVYPTLLEHISVHRYYMGIDFDRPIEWDEAVAHWHDAVYLPVVEAIRSHGLLAEFPDRTETDLYLFLAEHRARLEREFGWSLEGPVLAEGLAAQRRGRAEPNLDLGEVSRVAASGAGSASLLDTVLLLFVGDASDAHVQSLGLAFVAEEGADGLALRLGRASSSAVEAQRSAFLAASERLGVNSQFSASAEDVVKAVRQRAAYVDLIVAGMSAAVGEMATGPGGAAAGGRRTRQRAPSLRPLLRRCPKPLLLVNREGSALARPLVAFDGGAKAEEALYLAAYLALGRGDAPVVVSVSERSRPADANLVAAQRYLDDLGIRAEYVAEHGPVAAAIVRTLSDYRCDLLIMGSRRLSPWLEEITGGVLDDVLEALAPRPAAAVVIT